MNLIIGNASGYTFDQLKPWINSIRQTDFDGDVAITGTDLTGETVESLSKEGIIVNLFGMQQEDGGVVSKSSNVPHVERFFYISTFLEGSLQKYDAVVTTDIRDVIFQHNPFHWLADKLNMYDLVASSEGIRYMNEPWGNDNLYQSFGPHFYEKLKRNYIYNVGVIAGNIQYVHSILSLIFQLSLGRPIPVVDQAVYNYLLSVHPFNKNTFHSTHSDCWAAQLGTTREAVKAGAGDLGQQYKNDPNFLTKYNLTFEDTQPSYEADGTVVNDRNEPYCIVHQWDRVPDLKKKIEAKYE